MNRLLAMHVLNQLNQAGVREICLCAGARSAPLVSLLTTDTRFQTFYFFEERSAAFFGLGRIKEASRPVAVVTTSGTAAAELLPATMEGYYSSLPLILVTADRPREYRGTGAPQTAEQVGLYGIYAEGTVDLAGSERMDIAAWDQKRPLHINVCFGEPLLEPSLAENGDYLPQTALRPNPAETIGPDLLAEARARLSEFVEVSRSPIVIVGGLAPGERAAVLAFLTALGAPVILESLSGLRGHPALEPLTLRAGKDTLVQKQASSSGVWMDGVLRIGSVPTLRLWRDLESSLQDLPLLSLSSQPFSGASRGAFVNAPLSALLGTLAAETTAVVKPEQLSALMARDHSLYAALVQLLDNEPHSEPGLISRFSKHLPPGSRLFLGNSLPIREWDLAADYSSRNLELGASRGVNGIDGQISTALGFSKEGCENWALLGDLTAMYDMSAPWILRQLPQVRVHIVVLNNGGGKIFDRMFPDPAFQNQHDLSFAGLAQFWGLDYECWESIPTALPPASLGRGRSLIEIVPDPEATARFWHGYDTLSRTSEGQP